MKVAVLADHDGYIVAIAHCRASDSGNPGTFSQDIEVWAEITRSALDQHRGIQTSGSNGDEVISSVTVELPEDLSDVPLDEIQSTKVFDISGGSHAFSDKVTAG